MRRFRHKRKKRLPTTHHGTPSICVGDMRAYLVRRLSLTPALPQSPSPSLTSFRASPSPAPTTFFFLPISYNTSSSLAPPEKKKNYYQSAFVVVVVVALLKRCSIFRVSFVLFFFFYQEGARFSHCPCFCCSSSIKKVLAFLIFLFLVLLPKSCSIFPFSLLFLYQKGARFFHFFFFFLYR